MVLATARRLSARLCAGLRKRPLIATKCGRYWDKQRQIFPRIKKDSIHAEVEASLRRLGVDVIDLYQIHWPQPEEDIEEAWEAVAGLVRSGKVRYAGVSNFSVAQLRRMQPIHPVASLQPPYSMMARGVEAELLPYCEANGIGVIVYSPMQKGLLTDKVTRDWIDHLPAEDHRRGDVNFQEPRLSTNLDLVAALRSIAEKHGKTVSQLAIAWVLRRSEVTAAIVGARKPSQLEETASAADWQLSDAELTAIDKLL